jgi:hypothetical protein
MKREHSVTNRQERLIAGLLPSLFVLAIAFGIPTGLAGDLAIPQQDQTCPFPDPAPCLGGQQCGGKIAYDCTHTHCGATSYPPPCQGTDGYSSQTCTVYTWSTGKHLMNDCFHDDTASEAGAWAVEASQDETCITPEPSICVPGGGQECGGKIAHDCSHMHCASDTPPPCGDGATSYWCTVYTWTTGNHLATYCNHDDKAAEATTGLAGGFEVPASQDATK